MKPEKTVKYHEEPQNEISKTTLANPENILTMRGFEESGRLPDRITLYQRNIERICRTREEVAQEIRKTVFHEVGHHFGLDEDDLTDLGFD